MVDANDTIAPLMVWRDLNEDGVTQPGELFSLTDAGIASIAASAGELFNHTIVVCASHSHAIGL